jgi:glucose/arabinose dehydrogenase
VRLNLDGSVPRDNPFVGRKDARPEIWSYGHRNMQGLAVDPRTGTLWESEHGPRGGDEINLPQPGKNYGWPIITYGIDYSGLRIPSRSARRRRAWNSPTTTGPNRPDCRAWRSIPDGRARPGTTACSSVRSPNPT